MNLFLSQIFNLIVGAVIIMSAWNIVIVDLFEIGKMSYLQGIFVIMATEALCAMPIRDVKMMKS